MNGDLISRSKAIETIRAYGVRGEGYGDTERENDVCSTLENVPAEDAEVVRHGRWINNGWHDDDGKYHRAGYRCGECAGKSVITYPNCPWCRAKMDAKEDA